MNSIIAGLTERYSVIATSLPRWLKLCASSRHVIAEYSTSMSRLVGPEIVIDPHSERNREDIRSYVVTRVHAIDAQGVENIVENILRASDYNFLYLHCLFESIHQSGDGLNVDSLPTSIDELFDSRICR